MRETANVLPFTFTYPRFANNDAILEPVQVQIG